MADMTIHAADTHAEHSDAAQNENRKFAMWLYLASEVVIFSILIAGYALFRASEGNTVNLVKETLGIWLVTANTFVLLASSWAMVMGLRAIELGRRQEFYRWIGLTAILGVVFIGGQYVEYSELGHLGISLDKQDFTVATNIFEDVVHVEAVLDNGEEISLHGALPEDATVAQYHVDFVDDAELFRGINLAGYQLAYTSDSIFLNEAGEVLTDEQAIEDEIFAIQNELRANNIPSRDGYITLDRLAVETVDGEIVPFSAIVQGGQAVDLSPQEYDNLNIYFRNLIGDSASNYGMRFYAPTAFHGAHVVIGVYWALLVLWRGYRGHYDKNAIGVEMFGLYWHFVDVVWIVLFTLIYLV